MLLFGVARGKENSTLKEVVEEGSVSTEMGASFVSTVPMLCPHHCFRSWDMAAEVFVENEKEGCGGRGEKYLPGGSTGCDW